MYREQRKKENVFGRFDLTRPLFRIFPLQRFCDVLESKSLCLVKPALWDDPFENFLLSSKVYSRDRIRIDLTNLRNTIFGQCWTLHDETDAMWRIYSHDKCGIKVKVNAGKLYEQFFETATSPELRCFIGKVEYLIDGDIVNRFSEPKKNSDTLLNDRTGAELPKSFLVKRLEFKHENEVRLIYSTTTKDPIIVEDVYCFSIDSNDLFEEVVVDPRLDKDRFLEIRKQIEDLGYENDIRQSDLYKIPSHEIEVDFTMGIDVNKLNSFSKK